jgi:membrane-associated phospholipid phosphatase
MNTKTRVWRWSWSTPAVFSFLLVILLFPFDGVISRGFKDLKLGPDFRVELQTVQQYGQVSVTLIGMVVIWLLDPQRRQRLLDWLVAIGVTSLSCFLLKICIGRPRPKFDDPLTFVGLWEAYPFPTKTGQIVFRYAWDVMGRHPWDLWSMPSSHTALATVMSVFLAYLYPRLRPFCVTMVIIVGACRVLFRDHYVTDVCLGTAVGYVIAHYAISRRWGIRVVEWARAKKENRKIMEATVPLSPD